MPLGTPFHTRTAVLSASQNWRTWSGYTVAGSYAVVHDPEYHAIRNSAALIDISPLYKYDIRGRDALRFVNRVISRDAAKCAVHQALYACLCDNGGKVIQDGTVFRIGESHFRFHLAEPSLRWFRMNAIGMAVDIQDLSEQVAALALQGPTSRDILERVTDANVDALKFFRLTFGRIAGVECMISRTGYTGDLGYEIWLPAKDAEKIWDSLIASGRSHGITPAGLLALDLARLEAGFILLDVDYTSAEKAMIPSQNYSPFEIGLGWTVSLEKENFVGRAALLEEKRLGSRRRLVGLEVDWNDYERLYLDAGLAPQLPATAWRGGVPVYRGRTQLGQATTGGWSPTIKKYIALATVQSQYSEPGTEISMEVTVEYVRKRVKSQVVKTPFFDPPRKRS